MWVSYYIGNVCVSPDIEIMLERVLEDLEKDKEKDETVEISGEKD